MCVRQAYKYSTKQDIKAWIIGQAGKANTCKKPCKQKIGTKWKSETKARVSCIPSRVANSYSNAAERLDCQVVGHGKDVRK